MFDAFPFPLSHALVAAAAASVLGMAGSAEAETPPACRIGEIPVPPLATETLGAAEFAALHAALFPSGAGERWVETPWEADLASARRRASEAGKPLVLWMMDGHPLGCT